LPDLHCNGDSQCFPLYLYDEPEADQGQAAQSGLFASRTVSRTRRDAITDEGLAHFESAYPGEAICKEDVFYYVYGLLQSPDYRERYADNLSKELPRIPRVKTAADFRAYSKAGRDLAELHLNYETVPMFAGATVTGPEGKPFDFAALRSGRTVMGAERTDEKNLFRVEKMKYARRGKDKDLTTLIYNTRITVTGIPLEAYDYVVNGKPALDWVVERQCVKTDKDSGIVNDANDWAVETMHNPRYPLELFLRVITVSLDTMKIVRALPALDILAN
jgi:predicted helicase